MDSLEFRKQYRQNVIPAHYRPWLHVGFNFTVLSLLPIVFLFQVQSPSFLEWLTLLLFLVLGNFAVFFIHKYLLHRRIALIAPHTFDIHSKQHHLFYTHEHIEWDSTKDFYILFFPWWTIAAFAALLLPALYFSLSLFLSPNVVWLALSGASLYFLLYETLHWISHLPEQHPLLRVRGLRWMRNHHLVHHNPHLMHHYNFNIVYPLSDWLFKTTYKP